MTKASLFASAAVAALALGAVPVYAQNAAGPFADVPTDHWAYSAVDRLQKAGIVIGYPDMTYGGKRAMTRYEFAVAIARLLDKIPPPPPPPGPPVNPGITQDQLNQALAPYAMKSDLQGLAKQSDVDNLRRLVTEFQTELVTLGVDIDAVKRRLDTLEGRVKAIENELKRVQVGGAVNVYARGNNRFDSNNPGAVADWDGYHVTGGLGSRGGILADTRVLHDVDLKIKARLSEKATAETIINFGNYSSYLGSYTSYTGARSDRTIAGAGIDPFAGQKVNQDQITSIYKAEIDTPLKLWGIGSVDFAVGRVPFQLTPYTLKQIDVDSYFSNDKTDLGDIPMDGAKARFNLGPVTTTAFAAKLDPIQFVSNEFGNAFSTQNQAYGLYAGATQGPFFNGGRPLGSSISPTANGAIALEQLAGARATIGKASLGTLGGTIFYGSGQPSVSPSTITGTPDTQFKYFDRVLVYSGDVNTHLGGIGLVGSYNKSDTYGENVILSGNNGTSQVTSKIHSKITNENYAWDAAAKWTGGALTLKGGYKYIGQYFGAPGYWDKIGAWTNPVGLKGPYAEGKWAFSNQVALVAAGKFYQGNGGKFENDGGLGTDDKVQNLKAGLKFGVTSASSVDLGIERTEYKLSNGFAPVGSGIVQDAKPIEYFYNIGYGYSFNPGTSLKLLYQIIDYRDKNSGFDLNDGKGGVAAAQFSVKF